MKAAMRGIEGLRGTEGVTRLTGHGDLRRSRGHDGSHFGVFALSAHAKVTPIAHTAAGMGQVWYRVTGTTGVANVQVAYRVGVGDEDVRRVRFVGDGVTAELLGFRPGELITDPVDFLHVVLAFTGDCLTRGVKTQRSRLARVPAAPVLAAAREAMDSARLEPKLVFASRDAAAWWRAVARAGKRDRSVSFLTAAGALRAVERAGATIDRAALHARLGPMARSRLTGTVDALAGRDAVTQLDLATRGVSISNDLTATPAFPTTPPLLVSEATLSPVYMRSAVRFTPPGEE